MSTKTPKKRTWMDRLRTAFKAQDEAAMEEALEEAKKTGDEGGDDDEDDKKSKTGDAAIQALTKAVGKLTADMAALAKAVKDAEAKQDDEEEEEGKKTDDTVLEPETAESNPQAKGNVLSGDTLKAVLAKAEILLPGVQAPTGDSVKVDQIEALQRRALLGCLQASEAGRRQVTTFSQGRDIGTLTGDALAAVKGVDDAGELAGARGAGGGHLLGPGGCVLHRRLGGCVQQGPDGGQRLHRPGRGDHGPLAPCAGRHDGAVLRLRGADGVAAADAEHPGAQPVSADAAVSGDDHRGGRADRTNACPGG